MKLKPGIVYHYCSERGADKFYRIRVLDYGLAEVVTTGNGQSSLPVGNYITFQSYSWVFDPHNETQWVIDTDFMNREKVKRELGL